MCVAILSPESVPTTSPRKLGLSQDCELSKHRSPSQHFDLSARLLKSSSIKRSAHTRDDMSAPQDGYPQQGYPPAEGYGQQPEYAVQAAPPTQTGAPADKKKKRGYAAQAYEFGVGGNAALGTGAPPAAGGTFQPAAPQYGGYQAPEAQPSYGGAAPQYGAQAGAGTVNPQQPAYGQPATGGYQAPDAGYPGPGAAQGGVAGITQGMGQMGMGGGGQGAAQSQGAGGQRPVVLNQLYPTDLLNQPFNVAELDLPPPPIILPPNVRSQVSFDGLC